MNIISLSIPLQLMQQHQQRLQRAMLQQQQAAAQQTFASMANSPRQQNALIAAMQQHLQQSKAGAGEWEGRQGYGSRHCRSQTEVIPFPFSSPSTESDQCGECSPPSEGPAAEDAVPGAAAAAAASTGCSQYIGCCKTTDSTKRKGEVQSDYW